MQPKVRDNETPGTPPKSKINNHKSPYRFDKFEAGQENLKRKSVPEQEKQIFMENSVEEKKGKNDSSNRTRRSRKSAVYGN